MKEWRLMARVLCAECRFHQEDGASHFCTVPVREPVSGQVLFERSYCADARHFGREADRLHECGPEGFCWEPVDGKTAG